MKRAKTAFEGIIVQRDNVTPMYLQLAEAIEQRVLSGELRPGQPLETEHAICARFQISRSTTRLALDELVRRGRIERRQGKGSFVAHEHIRHNPQSMNHLFETLFSQGNAPSSELLTFGMATAPADVEAMFLLKDGEKLVRHDRRYILNGRPVGVARGWLLPGANVLSSADASTHSTARLLAEKMGLHLGRTDMLMRATAAGRAVARDLNIPERSPVLLLTRTRFLVDGGPAEFAQVYMNPDVYELSFSDASAATRAPALKLVAA
ncbi:GntR family transcriptional regulator [Agrobacterium vitis]|uniref:GntR family transcriptional regulator n=1 Tax=Agrobacterium vitis TaxID=373 RepID=UPI001574BFC2|nr:GntR family transcriptional regulator [Agrobacterium vitis]NSZ20054.1 GntR family transcriptional regulator [Agrobacterium vitis]QZO07493.1 GntR family transcriptional regulator [Agrobacterium vitis]UJL90687.1 GntR family transcriptional regulator [Agrobacterium vitis]